MATQILNHTQKVTRLYRKALKNMLSWTIDRDTWRMQACELRAEFDENKDVDLARGMQFLEEGEKRYKFHIHPDPYISPEAPEGSKWERNHPPPPHVLELLPEEKQWLDEWMKKAPK